MFKENKTKVEHSQLYNEYDTCAEFKIDPAIYFAKPRIERALMVATVLARNAISNMRTYDNRPKKKKKGGSS